MITIAASKNLLTLSGRRMSFSFFESLAVGGGSLLIGLILLGSHYWGINLGLRHWEGQIAISVVWISWVVNFPHFVWSYRLAYRQKLSFVMENSVALIILPALMLGLMVAAFQSWNRPISHFPWLAFIDVKLQFLGIFINSSLYSSIGRFLFGHLIIFQLLLSTRHYAFQALGISLAYAYKNGYSINPRQKVVLRCCVESFWYMGLVATYSRFQLHHMYALEYYSIRLPDIFLPISIGIFLLSFLVVLYSVLAKNFLLNSRWPPFNCLLPLAAVFVGLQPFWSAFPYQIVVVPIAHCIEYLFFCYHAERGRWLDFKKKAAWNSNLHFSYLIIFLMMIVGGYLFFTALPEHFDKVWVRPLATPFMATVAFYFFINVHHFFIDGVVWRAQNSEARMNFIRSFNSPKSV